MENAQISATARIKLTKLDDKGNVIEVEEHDIALTEEEVKNLWLSQQQE